MTNDTPTPLAVSIETAAGMLHCSAEMVWKLLRDGELTRIKLGSATRVSVEELRAFVAAGGTRDKGCYPTTPDQDADQVAGCVAC